MKQFEKALWLPFLLLSAALRIKYNCTRVKTSTISLPWSSQCSEVNWSGMYRTSSDRESHLRHPRLQIWGIWHLRTPSEGTSISITKQEISRKIWCAGSLWTPLGPFFFLLKYMFSTGIYFMAVKCHGCYICRLSVHADFVLFQSCFC